MERVRTKKLNKDGGSYFAAPKTDLQFISSGCRLFDLALGGGWAKNRVANIVGDKSTGKTLLCIEAVANHVIQYPKENNWYREAESAFDEKYAQALGMPVSRVDFGKKPIETVEDLFEDLEACCNSTKHGGLYILDSLDALSDRAELARNMDEGSYGAAKAKNMSQMFRRINAKVSASNITLMVVSQVRDAIGVKFGRKTKRSGGHALDFYASQVVYLAQLGKIYKTVSKVKRPVGVKIKALLDKNKVALPFREAEFSIKFGYGIDDEFASLLWLKQIGSLKAFRVKQDTSEDELKKLSRNLTDEDKTDLATLVTERWYAIETSFLPTKSKYGSQA